MPAFIFVNYEFVILPHLSSEDVEFAATEATNDKFLMF